VKADPDQIEVRVGWINGPVASRLYALVWLSFAVVAANSSTASSGALITMGVLGLVAGLALWRFDLWWDRRPAVRLVDSRPYTELRRYLPPLALELVTVLVAFQLAPEDTWAVFALPLFAVLQALVSPRSYRRRAARRAVKLLAVEAGE
jgi:hypothetical protein